MSVVGKRQWVVLPHLVTKELPGLKIRSPRFKEEQDRWPRWILGYIFSTINSETLSTAAFSAMKYG